MPRHNTVKQLPQKKKQNIGWIILENVNGYIKRVVYAKRQKGVE